MAIWLKGYKNLIIIAAYNIHHATTANHVLENPDSLLWNLVFVGLRKQIIQYC